MVSDEYRGARQWSRNQQAFATVVWVSFLSAAVGTMVFFALFDPVVIWSDLGRDVSRETGYALGFFFFWGLCAATAGLTAWLVRTAPKRHRSRHS
ncbi:MAG: hypothetical protein AAGI27_01210 [Pseudomonadota bacterium]